MPPPRPRGPGRPRSSDVTGIQESIVAAARQLFFEKGISATGMEAVARVAGISKQTLYARFASKEALYQAVVDDLLNQWRERQGPLLDLSGTLEGALCRHSVKTLETATREGSALLTRFLHVEAGQNPELARAIIGPVRARGIADIATILDAFCGEESPDERRAAAEHYFTLLIGKINDLSAYGGAADASALAAWSQGAVRLFLRGYQRGPAAPAGDCSKAKAGTGR